ncbi:MAG: ATP-binding cassette domain-containing protein [Bacteroidales bacterium]
MIIIENLVVAYQKDNNVLNHVNLHLNPGEIHGIVGLNGAGKTTLFNTMFGLIKPLSGSVSFNQERLIKKQIAYLETESYFYPNITGREYLSLFENKNFDLGAYNNIFELPLDSLIDHYSTGMKKKLAILGLLKLDKPVNILDEPFNGLDLETAKVLQLMMIKLKQSGKTIIVSSHILESLTSVCDSIHYLENGVITFSRTNKEFDNLERDIFHNFSKTQMINEL